MAMEELLAEVTLRNLRRVYQTARGFKVVQVKRHGEENSRVIPERVVEYVGEHFDGREVAVEDVTELLEDAHQELDLPFSYGFQIHFYAQDVLIVLVALDRSELIQEGQRLIYSISGNG